MNPMIPIKHQVVEQQQVFKLRHRKLDGSGVVEKTFFKWKGVECVCGNDVFRQRREMFPRVSYYYCSRCHGRPMLSFQVRNLEANVNPDFFSWMGFREGDAKA